MRHLCRCLLVFVFPALLSASPLPQLHAIRGRVVDQTGAPIAGARVIASPGNGDAKSVGTITNEHGYFQVPTPLEPVTITITAPGFDEWSRRLVVTADGAVVQVVLEVSGLSELVQVGARFNDGAALTSATRTPTPTRDVPQAISIVSRGLIDDQRLASMADVVRFMPGIGMAQGEGNRDTPVFRGNSSTSDFFVDGIRDDVQYFRDLYNVERVEALKGPNAMIFGRGGAGGVINRVTRQANWTPSREFTVQGGSWDNRRVTADIGDGVSDNIAMRVSGMYENSESYRRGAGVERFGVQPSAAFRLGQATTVRASYEFFRDERTADRGIPSFQGRPVDVPAGRFFGSSELSESRAVVNVMAAVVEHRAGPATIRSRTSVGDYDKFYQNVFPGAVNAAGTQVAVSAYNNDTQRRNVFNQTDVIVRRRTGTLDHTLLAGFELGRQVTSNFRSTGYFPSLGASVTSVQVPVAAPDTSLPITFRQSASDADNRGVATVAAVYAQDQVALTSRLHVIAGLRLDAFVVDFTNNRTNGTIDSRDRLLSPRAGVIYKPAVPVSLYGSYSMTYVPRAGEQLASLSATNEAFDPEAFRNYEAGVKWDIGGASLSAALYRLDRSNVAVPDPTDPTRSILVDAQRTNGFEAEISGAITRAWTLIGGYAYQDGRVTETISASAVAGARLPHLPRHAVSLWSKHRITHRLSASAGIVRRGEIYASTDNVVVLPAFTRVDAALFFDVVRSKLRAQVNVDNLFGAAYFASAHSNNNIMPGAPRSVKVALTAWF